MAEPKNDETAAITPDTRVESVTQYLDEMGDREAMQKMRAFIAQQRDLRQIGRGQWIWPDGYKHMGEKGPDGKPLYRCVRLGSLTDTKRLHLIKSNEQDLLAMGWKKCPPGMRFVPCPLEGDFGVYLYLSEAAGKVRDEWELECRKKIEARRMGRDSEDLSDLARTQGIIIEDIRSSTGKTSAREFMRGKRR